jgi:peptide/nickel transport system substrate-binding protein
MFMNFWFDSELWGLPGNRSFYANDQVDRLIRRAAMLSDQDERTDLYRQAQEIIMQEAPYIFLYQRQTIVPMHDRVKGYVYNPMLESMYNFEDISKE